MRRLVFAVLVAALCRCASAPSLNFRPYRVCVWNATHAYFDTGTVLDETVDSDGSRVYLVQLDRWPADGKHLNRVYSVDRVCAAVSMRQQSPFPPIDRQR